MPFIVKIQWNNQSKSVKNNGITAFFSLQKLFSTLSIYFFDSNKQ